MTALTGLDDRAAVILDALVSNAQILGLFERVNTHERKNATFGGMGMDIWMSTGRPNAQRSGLASTSAVLIYMARMTINMLREPQDNIDPTLLSALGKYVDSLHDELSLGDPGSSIDVFGMQGGTGLSWAMGYWDQDKTEYRAAVIVIPVIVDDVWVQVN